MFITSFKQFDFLTIYIFFVVLIFSILKVLAFQLFYIDASHKFIQFVYTWHTFRHYYVILLLKIWEKFSDKRTLHSFQHNYMMHEKQHIETQKTHTKLFIQIWWNLRRIGAIWPTFLLKTKEIYLFLYEMDRWYDWFTNIHHLIYWIIIIIKIKIHFIWYLNKI